MAALEPATELVLQGTGNALQAQEDGQAYTLAWLVDTDAGTRVVIYRMAFGNARLCIGPLSWAVYDAGYCYDGLQAAILGAVEWILAGEEGEPAGWKKNLQTGEYRERTP